ncbi:MAG: carbohydrate kinase family protein [bacterium]|nr:carbohydrate kinase family protein [bacterium]
MFDVITIGTAVRDAFVVLKDVKDINVQIIKDTRFKTGKAVAFSHGSKISIPSIVFTTGGGATNAAATFGRQGFKTACFCVVGADVSGETVMRELQREKVRFLFKIDPNKEHKTGYSIILLSPDGERTILTYRGASEDLRPNMIPWQKLNARMLYLAPLGGANTETFATIVRHARRKGVALAVNPSSKTIAKGLAWFSRAIKGAAVLILNEEEAAYLTGLPYGEDEKIFKKLDRAIGGIIVMTKGPQGVVVSDGKRIYSAGVFRERALVDRTGAGDAFGSGFVAGLIQRQLRRSQKTRSESRPQSASGKGKAFRLERVTPEDVHYAIRLGSANGTSVVEHIGAKEGVLTARAARAKRWQSLPVRIKLLNT